MSCATQALVMIRPDGKPLPVFTLSPLKHPLEALGAVLRSFGIKTIVDLRSRPADRKLESRALKLERLLAGQGIGYVALPELRESGADPATPRFAHDLMGLLLLCQSHRCVLLCDGPRPSRDWCVTLSAELAAHGIEMLDILEEGRARSYRFASGRGRAA